MLEEIKEANNVSYTENGALSLETTNSNCLDFFAKAGAMRNQNKELLLTLFNRSWAENKLDTLKILFFLRDIREGLGEREVFRTIVKNLTPQQRKSIKKNYSLFPLMGRYDDLFSFFGTECEESMLKFIKAQLESDIEALSKNKEVSLLAKWLPSINATNGETIRKAKLLCTYLDMNNKEYRKLVASLRKKIGIIENNLRIRDYSFDYSKQCSKAMMKYTNAFITNDKDRYMEYLNGVKKGEKILHTETLLPYDIVAKCFSNRLSLEEIEVLDTTWKSLPNFVNDENAIAVVDGSGSMYFPTTPYPAAVAQSLGIYFAEHAKGEFHNHFITFSNTPRLIEIKGNDIVEKVHFCMDYNECANTNIQATFDLILNVAVKNHIPQPEMIEKIYIISDMEFDIGCDENDQTNFEVAKGKFEKAGYNLPTIVFWNVRARGEQVPIKRDERGVTLVSGFSPVLFRQVTGENVTPYSYMRKILDSKRYEQVKV